MVQLQPEVIPTMAGFSLGAALLLLKRLVPLKALRPGCGKSTKETPCLDQDSRGVGGAAQGSAAEAGEPGPEPGPEPLPAADADSEAPALVPAKEPAPPRARRSGTLATVFMHVVAGLLLALCWAPALHVGIPATGGPQAAVRPQGDALLLQRAEHQPAPAASVEPHGPLDSEPAPASDRSPEPSKSPEDGAPAVGEQAESETDLDPLQAEGEASHDQSPESSNSPQDDAPAVEEQAETETNVDPLEAEGEAWKSSEDDAPADGELAEPETNVDPLEAEGEAWKSSEHDAPADGELAEPETNVDPLEAAYHDVDGEPARDEGAPEDENLNPVVDLNTTSQAYDGGALEDGSRQPAAPPSAGVITMALTRQQMAMPTKDGNIYYKSAYWGVVEVGSPPVPFKVVFDTGSGHLLLPSSYCHSQTCRSHTRYRRSRSSTGIDIDHDGTVVPTGAARDQITVNFGTGEVTGVFVEDVVCTRELTDEEAARVERGLEMPTGCMQFRLIAATEMSQDPFETFHFDGVLGLGLKGSSQSPDFNFFHMLSKTLTESKVDNPHTFGIFLAQNDEEKSEVTIGGYGANHFAGDVHWNPVLHPELGHWMVKIKSIKVDDEPVSFCEEGCSAILDTGTSLLAVPTASFSEIFKMLRHPPAPGFTDCTGPGPKLNIELEALTMTLDPEDYARTKQRKRKVQPAAEPGAVAAPAAPVHSDRSDVYCKPMLMTMELPQIGPKVFILGEPVLRKYYTVFDSKTPQLGFASATHVGRKKGWPADVMVEPARSA